jgi:hypothetical protein
MMNNMHVNRKNNIYIYIYYKFKKKGGGGKRGGIIKLGK